MLTMEEYILEHVIILELDEEKVIEENDTTRDQ